MLGKIVKEEALGVSSSSTEANFKRERTITINNFKTLETNQTCITTKRVLERVSLLIFHNQCMQTSYIAHSSAQLGL